MFSPVAKIDTIRVLFSIVANKGWPLHQFDVTNAFLHGELKEEVYMDPPPGYVESSNPREDLGRLKYFFGIEVLRSKQGIFIYQKKYVLDLLEETGMIDCKPVDTPMMVNQKLYMEEKAKLADKGRYLKGTLGDGVLFKANGHLETQVYIDADWAGDKGNLRSTSGYFTLVGGNIVTWRSKKQKVVALSSAEAEFRGIARGLAEAL
nr:hypothetical protein [Tanacetum cinerariifolium]